MFVLLKGPTGYYWIGMACSKKHFELIDSGYEEIESGFYMKLFETKSYLEWYDFTEGGKRTPITVKRKGQYAYRLYDEISLEEEISKNPNFFDEFEIMDNSNWFGNNFSK